MYFVKSPKIIQRLFPKITWTCEKNHSLHLTFDDGPDPDSTRVILDFLQQHNIKATFFCIGQNAERYPDLIDLIRRSGHTIGNHGYAHLDGWHTSTLDYLRDIEKAALHTSQQIFRPPYGRITYAQYRKLIKLYDIVMWDVMPGDFDKRINANRMWHSSNKHIASNSIIVLHDDPTCLDNTLGYLNYLVKTV